MELLIKKMSKLWKTLEQVEDGNAHKCRLTKVFFSPERSTNDIVYHASCAAHTQPISYVSENLTPARRAQRKPLWCSPALSFLCRRPPRFLLHLYLFICPESLCVQIPACTYLCYNVWLGGQTWGYLTSIWAHVDDRSHIILSGICTLSRMSGTALRPFYYCPLFDILTFS